MKEPELGKNSRSLHSASLWLELVTFFIFRFSLRPEISQEHLPTGIAGVLRLRAIKPSVAIDLRSASLRMTALSGA
jgi:hypothetical protein